MPAPRRTAAVLAAVAALVAAPACGDDTDGTATTPSTTTGDAAGSTVATGSTPATGATTTPPADDLPPRTDAELAALYGPVLEPLGLEFTRGSLIVGNDGSAHLALYVVPTDGADSPQDYLDRVLPLNAALDPLLFEEFDDLDSFDICQEPVPVPGQEERFPPPQVLLLMGRDSFESVDDWSTATLADLIAAVEADPDGEFDVHDDIEALPDWQAAEAEAEG